MTEQRWPDQTQDIERVSPVALALAAGALALAVTAILANTGQASTAPAGGQSCSDRVNSWAADMAPQTNGFNNEDIARRAAEVDRAAAAALEQC